MKTRQIQFYAPYSTHETVPLRNGAGPKHARDIEAGEAAEYIASLLAALRDVAAEAKLPLLADLISVAEEEARFHSRP